MLRLFIPTHIMFGHQAEAPLGVALSLMLPWPSPRYSLLTGVGFCLHQDFRDARMNRIVLTPRPPLHLVERGSLSSPRPSPKGRGGLDSRFRGNDGRDDGNDGRDGENGGRVRQHTHLTAGRARRAL